jgi:hypothetical protein
MVAGTRHCGQSGQNSSRFANGEDAVGAAFLVRHLERRSTSLKTDEADIGIKKAAIYSLLPAIVRQRKP